MELFSQFYILFLHRVAFSFLICYPLYSTVIEKNVIIVISYIILVHELQDKKYEKLRVLFVQCIQCITGY